MSDLPPPGAFPPPGPQRGSPPTSPPTGPPPGFGPPQPTPFHPSPLTPQSSDIPTIEPLPEPTPVWKRWWFIVGLVAAVAAVVGIVIASEDDEQDVSTPDISAPVISEPDISLPEITLPVVPETPPDTAPATDPPSTDAPSTEAPSTEPATSTPTVANPVAGESVTLDDGTVARVNSLTPNAPPVDDFFLPDPGTTLSRVDLEVCGGSDGYSANSLYWLGFLEDNTTVDPFIFGGDLPTVTVAPGSCIRGTIDLQVPDGHTVSSVVMRGPIFDEVARWDVTTAVPVGAPLQSPSPPPLSGLGETVTIADGSTAVVKSVQPNAPPLEEFFPPDEGRQFVRIEVEQCAGSSPRQVNPAYWYAAGSDNRTGSATFGGSTLTSIQLAAGQCAAGFVEIDLPADASVATVFVTDEALREAARWRAT